MAGPMTDRVVSKKDDTPKVARRALPIVGSTGGWKNDG